ncbi:MAG: hypothetical protein CL993_03710 [Euryarchaeota archaeon]|nr:hypothetical protein [Euryarchaeota archaeon]
MSKQRLVVITGTSGVGKSTLAGRINSEMSFDKMTSTDTIREVLRTRVDLVGEGALHRSSFENAGSNAVENWKETVEILAEGISSVINRAENKIIDLIIEGVHFLPTKRLISNWEKGGGIAVGIVLYVENLDIHKEMISNREKHNGKKVNHYLNNIDRIREIQSEMMVRGIESGWKLIDITRDENPIDIVKNALDEI